MKATLQRLSASEQKKLLALAAVTLKAKQKSPEIVAIIRSGEVLPGDILVLTPSVVHALACRLIARKRANDAVLPLEPLTVDVSDLERDAAQRQADADARQRRWAE
jgi:hypothetical protein